MTDPYVAAEAAYLRYMEWADRADPFRRDEASSWYAREAVRRAVTAALDAKGTK